MFISAHACMHHSLASKQENTLIRGGVIICILVYISLNSCLGRFVNLASHTSKQKVQALQDKVRALQESEAQMRTAMVDTQLEHSEVLSTCSMLEACAATTEALATQVKFSQSAMQSSIQAHTHETRLLKMQLAAHAREQRQVCSERDAARQQAAEWMEKVRTSTYERTALEEKWAQERAEVEGEWRLEIDSLRNAWELERASQEEKWVQEREALEDDWARVEKQRDEDMRAEREKREEEWRMDRADNEQKHNWANATISAQQMQAEVIQKEMDAAQIAIVLLRAEAEGLSKRAMHCHAALVQTAEAFRRARDRRARSKGFFGWKTVYNRRQIVRTCTSLARHKTTSISLARVVALWRQQPVVRSLLLALQTRGHASIQMRRKRKMAERVVQQWRDRCKTFAHVTMRLLDITAQIRKRLLWRMLVEFRRLLSSSATSRLVRYGKARYLAELLYRRALLRTVEVFKRLISRSRNRQRACTELLPVIARDESAAALRAWWIYRSTCRKVQKLLVNVSLRNENHSLSVAFETMCIRACAARQWRCRRLFRETCWSRALLEEGWAAFLRQMQHFQSKVKHQHTALIVLRCRRREIEMQRLRRSVLALQAHTRAMLDVKSILSLSAGFASPQPLLITHTGSTGRRQTPNFAYRLVSSAIARWQAGMNAQAAFKEATRRVIISRRKCDKEMVSALVSARRELLLLRSFASWRRRGAESLRHPTRIQRVGGLVSHDVHRIAQGFGKLAHIVGFPLEAVLDCSRLAKCTNSEGLLHELNIACKLATSQPAMPEVRAALHVARLGLIFTY